MKARIQVDSSMIQDILPEQSAGLTNNKDAYGGCAIGLLWRMGAPA
jgi:hypothetical protein